MLALMHCFKAGEIKNKNEQKGKELSFEILVKSFS